MSPPPRLAGAPRSAAAVVAAAAAIAAAVLVTAAPTRAATPPVVGTAPTPDGTGWWTVDGSGDVAAGGSARDLGGLGGMHLSKPVVGIAPTADGAGYWLVASDGGVFSFGDARFFGSTGSMHLNRPVVGMAATPDGGGYWMVASDGGIFAFGDAGFHGSTGGIRLNQPIVGMTPSADGGGYWMVAADGGIFAFGDAAFFGSTGEARLASPIVGMASTHDRGGYWLAEANGSVHPFGDAAYSGSAPGTTTLGVLATPGGGYTLLTTGGPVHEGAPVASAWSTSAAPGASSAPAPPPAAPASSPVGAGAAGGGAPGAAATGRTTTIGTDTTPQVVRVGATLRQIDPADPARYLPGAFKFAGDDAYELTTQWADNVGCGTDIASGDMDWYLKQLGPDAVVRTWFFQQLATNHNSGALDWNALDRVVALADRDGVHLIATLGNQDGTCDDGGHWKDPSWYAGGYEAPAPGQRYSYAQWVSMVVQRYAGNPAILAWEPINEPRPDTCTDSSDCWGHRTCPSDATANSALRSFYDAVGARIRGVDPNHLISDGAPAGPAGCGTATWSDMQQLEASPGIDLMSFHDYTGGNWVSSDVVQGWDGISAAVDKPVFAGENGGISATGDAYPASSCPTMSQRASTYASKITNEYQRMPSFTGWLLWNASYNDQHACDWQTWGDDPLTSTMAQIAAAERSSS